MPAPIKQSRLQIFMKTILIPKTPFFVFGAMLLQVDKVEEEEERAFASIQRMEVVLGV